MENTLEINAAHEATTADMLNSVYAYAYAFYEQGRLDDAEVFFRYLCLYDFANPDYALGLGATYQLKKQFAQAIDVYRMVSLLNRRDCRPVFYTGQCHLMLRNVEEAKRCFERVLTEFDATDLARFARNYLDLIALGQTG